MSINDLWPSPKSTQLSIAAVDQTSLDLYRIIEGWDGLSLGTWIDRDPTEPPVAELYMHPPETPELTFVKYPEELVIFPFLFYFFSIP